MKKKKKSNAKPKYKPSATALGISEPEGKVRPGEPIPVLTGPPTVEHIKSACATYEKVTGAKANQTRLIDFVRWCEDNSGLL